MASTGVTVIERFENGYSIKVVGSAGIRQKIAPDFQSLIELLREEHQKDDIAHQKALNEKKQD